LEFVPGSLIGAVAAESRMPDPLPTVTLSGAPVASPSGGEADVLPREELKRRASAGVSIVASRGLAILLLSMGGTVVVARLLTPHDFGVIAIGMSVVLFTSMVSDGGLGAGLIRRAEPPAARELEALTGLQLGVTGALTVATTAVAAPFGEIGWVTALMVSSMPLAVLQFPGKILLERALAYKALALVEVSQVLVYQAWAILFVALGYGVWGLASATVVMRLVAALLMARISPAGFPRPRFSWRLIRPLLGFGLRFQATSAVWLLRDQGLNVALAAIAGVPTLGLWSFARRLTEVPYLLFNSLFRVSFPTMSQLVARGDDPGRLIERAVGMAAIGSGCILTGLAGSAPGLLPGVFGEQWRAASTIMPLACLGLGIGGSVSVATQGFLYAVGDASAVLRAVSLQAVTLFAVTLPLLPPLGIPAIGLGLLVSFVVEALALGRATQQRTSVHLIGPLVAPVLAGVGSASVGWFASGLGGDTLLSGLAGGACSVLLFLSTLALTRRKLFNETLGFAVGSLRAAASRSITA
jgi:O-antigen/teichoic acid export membrane protein